MLKSISNLSISSKFSEKTNLPAKDGKESIKAEILLTSLLKLKRSSEITELKTEINGSCRECGQVFDCSQNPTTILSPNPQDPSLCQGCRKLFSLTRRSDIDHRFNHSVNHDNSHESRFLYDWYLHCCSSILTTAKTELYHLPLSITYYRKRINETNEAEFAFECSRPDKNTVSHYEACSGCTDFVKSKRRTLKLVTNRKTNGGYIASTKELFEFLVKSNSKCVFTGMQGSWAPFPAKLLSLLNRRWVRDHFVNNALFFLSIDHIIPLSGGGASDVGNLQVSLQCLNNVKGNYNSKEFQKWLEAFKQHQGYL